MPLPINIINGYRRFKASRYYGKQRGRFEQLAHLGQVPSTLLIGCSDSRADPNMIFDTEPGDLFIVRNVANLVPPYADHGQFHGTSAALEYAVVHLKIPNIVVLGHSHCGGIKAFCDLQKGEMAETDFISVWLSILNKVTNCEDNKISVDDIEGVAQAAIRISLENLRSFPFVKEAEDGNHINLYGAYFDIGTGTLLYLDQKTNKFEPLEV